MRANRLTASTCICLLLLVARGAAGQASGGEHTIDLGATVARAVTFDDHLDHDPSWSPDGRWIVYVSKAEGPDGVDKERLWIAPATGDAPPRRLTSGHGEDEEFPDYYPAWSPDGELVAFSSGRGGETHIWVVPAAGGEPQRVTQTPLGVIPSDTSVRWSPDGRQLACVGAVEGGDTEVFVVPLGGGSRRRLTFDATANYHPDWSPDGGELAYGSQRSGEHAIWISRLDGTVAPRLLETGLPAGSAPRWPRYSPDGRWIAFQANLPTQRQDIFSTVWVVPAGGGQAVRVTPDTAMAGLVPAWSPDGHHLAVTGYAIPEVYLAVMAADSGAVLRLAPAAFGWPAWSPDGKRLAYRTDAGELATISSTGGDPSVLLGLEALPGRPSWSPDGGALALGLTLAGQQSRNVYTLELQSGQLDQVTVGRQWVTESAWSPDGEDIAFLATEVRGTHSDIWVVSAYGGLPRRLTSSAEGKGDIMWSPEGGQIWYCHQSVPSGGSRWDYMGLDPAGGKPPERLFTPPEGYQKAYPAPDGSHVLLTNNVWSLAPLHIASWPAGEPRSLGVQGAVPVFSPDGSRIAFITGEFGGFNIWTIDVRPILAGTHGPEL